MTAGERPSLLLRVAVLVGGVFLLVGIVGLLTQCSPRA
jgi:hypothetical protein